MRTSFKDEPRHTLLSSGKTNGVFLDISGLHLLYPNAGTLTERTYPPVAYNYITFIFKSQVFLEKTVRIATDGFYFTGFIVAPHDQLIEIFL